MYHWPFRRKARLLWWVLCTLVLASVPYTIWEFKEKGYPAQYVGWTISGVFVLLTIPVTVYQVALHVQYYNAPELQRHVVRILLMVPIYAMVSWLSLRFNSCRWWLTPMRECYEAVVLWSFYCYLIGYLQKVTGDYGAWKARMPPQKPMWPFNSPLGHCVGIRTIDNGPDFMHIMRRGVLAYVVVRPSLALVQILCMLTDTWGEQDFTLQRGWLWCMIINNLTQFWALYCLFAMYHATAEELEDIRPFQKFLLIKMVVFFTFWQGFLLSILSHFGVIKSNYSTYQSKAASIQDVIVCIECLPASLMFAITFPARDYMLPGEQPGTILDNIVSMFDVRDLGRDVGGLVDEQVNHVGTLATLTVAEAASAAQEMYRLPMDAVSKPVRQLAQTYLPDPLQSRLRENGLAMQPLLSAVQHGDVSPLDES